MNFSIAAYAVDSPVGLTSRSLADSRVTGANGTQILNNFGHGTSASVHDPRADRCPVRGLDAGSGEAFSSVSRRQPNLYDGKFDGKKETRC
jgi:hypothetical protein